LPKAWRDGGIAKDVLAEVGVHVDVCRSGAELCAEIERGAAAALIVEEQLSDEVLTQLQATLAKQPPWSDFPLLVIGAQGREWSTHRAPSLIALLGNVTLLDAPLRMRTLTHAADAAIRSRQRQYTARQAIDQRDRFLAMLGHELRNPLSVVSLAVQVSKDDPSRAAAQIPVLQRQVKHLSALLDDLLDVARVSSGKIVLNQRPVALAGVLERLTHNLRPRFDDRQLTLRLAVDDRARDEATVLGDPVRLQQILSNLLTNALKYTPPGGEVELSLAIVNGAAQIGVCDSGIGIAPEVLPHVFDLFVQAQTSLARADGGMGVGLSLVKTLVELHGGEVRAQSDGLGHGTNFKVWLPVIHERAKPPPHASQLPNHRPDRGLVVVIEDNSDSRDLLVLALERVGHRVIAAASGEHGLALLSAEPAHAAIIDIGLPGIDGYEVARQARATHGDGLLLIALTGYGQASDRQHATDAGFDVHLTKPPGIARLCALLS